MSEELTAIVVAGHDGVIGDGVDQPWHLREDQRRFRRLTMGGALIMGRRTYQAIGRALPGRRTVVLTGDPSTDVECGVQLAEDPDRALELARADDLAVFVAGGGQIYRVFWDRLTRLEVTRVDAAAPGAVTFPRIDPEVWTLIGSERHDPVGEAPGFEFQSWRRA